MKIGRLEDMVRQITEPRSHIQETKPISEFKIVQNIQARAEYKQKARESKYKFISATGQVEPAYANTIKDVMTLADAEFSVDLEHGRPQPGGVGGVGAIVDVLLRR